MTPEIKILPVHFVSYSSLNDLHSCPRKFELRKMGEPLPEFKSFDFTYGSSVGAGIQELLVTGDRNKAWLAAFLAWDMDLDAGVKRDEKDRPDNSKKCFPAALQAIEDFIPHLNVLNAEWEVFLLEDGKPAVELSAAVHFPNGFRYRIYIDVVLRNKNTGQLLVLELKTTGSNNVQEASYGNSNQALSYSVILDKIAPGNTSYFVWYFVYCTGYKLPTWEFFPFAKTRLHKANWIRTVLYDTGNINSCLQGNFFPKQGESCLAFGRPCVYYGSCDMSNQALYAGPNVIDERVTQELLTDYTYEFTVNDLIDQQLEEINAETF
jgi:hypothetical protein